METAKESTATESAGDAPGIVIRDGRAQRRPSILAFIMGGKFGGPACVRSATADLRDSRGNFARVNRRGFFSAYSERTLVGSGTERMFCENERRRSRAGPGV